MKSNHKNILACALCAGLLTVGTAKTQATVIDDELALNVTVQLTALTTTSRGKVQKTRITTKDLLSSINDTTRGDTIVYWFENEHFWVMDKRGVLQEDLTDDGILVFDTSVFSENSTSFSESETGIVEVGFFSAGGEDDIDSDLTFDLDGTFTFSDTRTHILKNGRFFESSTFNFSNLGNEGFDANIDDSEDVPMSGSISMSGSGILVD